MIDKIRIRALKSIQDLTVQDDTITNSLLEQVNYWMDYIVGTTLHISDIKKTNYLQVKYNNNPANASSKHYIAGLPM